MGISPQQLSNQIEMDKSTVSSHPAFDATNLKHFVDMVDTYITNDGMQTEREYKEDDSEENISSGTSNTDDEYSYSTSNAEEYVPNDAMSLASADPYPLHCVHAAPHNIGFMDSIKENNNIKNQAEKVNIFKKAILKQEEFFKCLQDKIYNIETNNFHTSEIYGLVISFMGRHDRWLNCRLVCKKWNELVYNRYWIYTEHMTMDEANKLKPGDKVDHRDDAGRWIKSTILGRKDALLNIHYDGWSSKWDLWCDYSVNLHKFAAVRSISRCPRVRGKHIEEKMFVDVKPSYRHGKDCYWRKGKVRRFDGYSGQIEVIYKYKNKKYLLWVHLDNKNEIDRLGKHTKKQNNVLLQHENENKRQHNPTEVYISSPQKTYVHNNRNLDASIDDNSDPNEDEDEKYMQNEATLGIEIEMNNINNKKNKEAKQFKMLEKIMLDESVSIDDNEESDDIKRQNRLLLDQIQEIQKMNAIQMDDMIKENIELQMSCNKWKEMYEIQYKENNALKNELKEMKNEMKLLSESCDKNDSKEGEITENHELNCDLLNEINEIVMSVWNGTDTMQHCPLHNNQSKSKNNGQGNNNNSDNSNKNNNNNSNDNSGGYNGNNGSNEHNGNSNGASDGNKRDQNDDNGDKKRNKNNFNESKDEDDDEEDEEDKEEQEQQNDDSDECKLNASAQEFIPNNCKSICFFRKAIKNKCICILAPINENNKSKLSNSMKQQMIDDKSDYSYNPKLSLRAKCNIEIPKIMTGKNGIIINKIKENLDNLYFYMDKTIAMQKHKIIKVNEEEMKIINYDIHDKITNEKLYCIVKKNKSERNGKFEWKMVDQLFSAKDIYKQYNIAMDNIPKSVRTIEFQSQLNKQTKIKSIMVNKMKDIIHKTKWNKIAIKNKYHTKKRMTLSLTKEMFIKNLKSFNDYNDMNAIKLVPILMFNNVNNSHWIEYVWIIKIDNGINIGISLKYNNDNDNLIVKGIHLDKTYIIQQSQLVSPKYCSNGLDGIFTSNITDICIGNPDDNINAIKALKQRNVCLQKENKRLNELLSNQDLCSSVSNVATFSSGLCKNVPNVKLSSNMNILGSMSNNLGHLLYQVYIIGGKLVAVYP